MYCKKVMKKFILIACFLASFTTFTQEWEWVRTISGQANDTGHSIEVDDSGYVFMTGRSKWQTTFEDPSNPIGPIMIGDRDTYISKYSPNGNLIWAKQAGTPKAPLYDLGYCVKSDKNGGCYVCGIYNDTSFFGNDTLISSGLKDGYLTHLNANGDFLWSKRFGGIGNDFAKGISVDSDGNVYVCGSFEGAITFNGNSIGSINQYGAIIIKYDQNGNFLDYLQLASNYKCSFEKLIFDDSNNIYVTGSIHGYGIINGTTISSLNSASWNDMILIKLSNDFNSVLWSTSGGGSYYDIGNILTKDSNSIYVGGAYSNTATFDTITTVYNSNVTGANSYLHRDAFIASYDLNGNIKWLKSFGDDGIDEVLGLKMSKSGYLYAAGFYVDTITIDDTTLISTPNITNGFILKLDTLGNLIWAKSVPNNLNTRLYGLTLDKYENIFVTGDFYGTINFNNNITFTGQNRDAYGGKLVQPPSTNYSLITLPPFCIGDTIKIKLSAYGSPLNFSYTPYDNYNSWLDSNYIFYTISESPLMILNGQVITNNDFYSDTSLYQIQINTFDSLHPYLVNDTILCSPINSFELVTTPNYENYIWSNDPNNNSNSNTVFSSGIYTITVTDTNGCHGKNSTSVVFSDCLNLFEQTSSKYLIFYNNQIKNINNQTITNLFIYNELGQIVLFKNTISPNEIIDLSLFNNGMYYIKYDNNTKKIIINQ